MTMGIMNLFKKKKQVFGADVEADCSYCKYNMGDDKVKCRFGDAVCKKYIYDPTKRQPKGKAKLKSYSEDDFSL